MILPLDETRLVSSQNIAVSLKFPSLFPSLLLKGRIDTYKRLLSKILKELSRTGDDEISACLSKTLETGRLFFPQRVRILDGSRGLVPPVVSYYLCRANQPEQVVETGVWTGKTSWFILQALQDNNMGHLTSIDLGLTRLEYGQTVETLPTNEIGGFVPKQLRERWQLLTGDSAKILPKINSGGGEIGLFLHDSNHSYEHMTFEYDTVWPLILPGGLLCSDDVDSNSAWTDFLMKSHRKGSTIQSRFGVCKKEAK